MGRKAAGCGLGVILAVVLVISFVGWALSFLGGQAPIRQMRPVPVDMPPARGAAVPAIDVHAPGRTADKLTFWADPLAAEIGVSSAAIRAYANAELIAQDAWPTCNLSWNTLAGLGYVETRHGTYSGTLFNSRQIDENGYVLPPILGPALDGSPGFAEIRDTDGGRLDTDTEYDRAVGPMQFIPTSWERFGLDANGDWVADPNQIDDAALSAANLLCQGRDLSVPEQWQEAILSYNRSNQYVINVRNAAASYALGQPAS
ncbi:lytic transglycosylase domain-containing protein [Corynebacterium kozikiae]|uniref:lytic transglycosylase domain-containing protein n=1 Tax=Corynebacterium kozikiae TaxID=2968469 RepID=UPI00211C03F2|nr:lytic murein transglycosylase [Corynebacterium sp. 76QC2CO]